MAEPSPSRTGTHQTSRDTAAIANQIKRCIYGTLLGAPIGFFTFFAIIALLQFILFPSLPPPHTATIEFKVQGSAHLIAGSIGLIAIGRWLINMEILRASIISACFAVVLGGGITEGAIAAGWIVPSPLSIVIWTFAALATQGLFLALRLRLWGRE
jgi:hypothetical protein